jgi:transmembrane sensor
MNRDEKLTSVGEPTAEIRAQAAAWIASLHDESRDEKLEAGFRRWLAADARHRAAFEMANEIWMDTDSWPRPAATGFARRRGLASLAASPRPLALAASLAIALVAGALFLFRGAPLITEVGEQRNLVLEDGSRVTLNTDSRVRIDYSPEARRVRVESGEALFEVAKRAGWPFVVTAGDRQITALGTAFVVRRQGGAVSVTLVEGKVRVAPAAAAEESAPASAEVAVLTAGERLTFVEGKKTILDRPVVANAVAWQRGQVVFDRTPLSQAVAEMNRYSPVKLAVESESARGFLVTGIFRTGDSESFVQAVKESFYMEPREDGGRIVLHGGRDAGVP